MCNEGVTLLGLGEVDQASLDALASGLSGYSFGIVRDDRAPPQGRHVGVIYRDDVIKVIYKLQLGTMWGGQYLSGGLALELSTVLTHTTVTMFVVHWHSRTIEAQGERRSAAASQLQTRIESIINRFEEPHIVVMGDFNDEPFDKALTEGLLGSRDRDIPRKHHTRLYNPFWRMMGERHAVEDELAGHVARGPRGTYYCRSSRSTHWHTFDQILVSSAFLDSKRLTLRERQTRIWYEEPLANDSGRIAGQFDHLPVLIEAQEIS